MKFVAPVDWTTDFLKHGLFADLEQLFGLAKFQSWPSLVWLNELAQELENANGQPIRFIANDEVDWKHGYYEEIIFDKGHIPTRMQNWHDLFGALIWILFPKTKACLNQLHIEQIKLNGKTARCETRNAITLFDECGVVVLCQTPTADLLKNHQWLDGFFYNRNQWHKNILPFVFGHANYEMATRPFIGLTGKALYLNVNMSEIPSDLKDQYKWLDQQLMSMVKQDNILENNKNLYPLPLLGVPNWYDENKEKGFYENTSYFRPKRRRVK
jgi:hypothetical protein